MKKTAILALALACNIASAALDDKPAAGATTTQAVTSAGVAYSEVTRTLRSQTMVHEFVDAGGTVFAVSWSGPFKADLQQLLGRHFDAVAQHRGQHRGDRSHARMDDGDLVVVSSGHMGAFQGRAWLRSRLPDGFDPQEME
jgi:hypothetical protein